MAQASPEAVAVGGAGGPAGPLLSSDGLRTQNRDVVLDTLSPLTPEVISRQATINIGTIGHVAHGKSTTVKAISGVYTIKYKAEKVRNITIKLGYANAKIYKSSAAPWIYTSRGSETPDEFPIARDPLERKWQLVRHVSFVDCPGHDILMATMLNGAAVMDAALLLIAASEPCPQPQTSEHLAAVDIMQLKNIIILQNKVDLVKEEQARDQYEKIKAFVTGTVAEGAPIIPISAQLQYNIDLLAQYIACHIPVPTRNFLAPPRMLVIRSFDVNKPGEDIEKLKGGIAGGSIIQGVLRVGDEIELRPGIIAKSSDGTVTCIPMVSRILTLYAEKNALQFAVPGGLIGIGTQIDPTLTRSDRLVGQVLGHKGALPDVFVRIKVQYHLLRRLLGVKAASEGDKSNRVSKLKAGEILMANIGSTSTSATVVSVSTTEAELSLAQPVCTDLNSASSSKIALSRRIENHWRLIGWGVILSGDKARGPKKQRS